MSKDRLPPFIQLPHHIFDSEAFQSLDHADVRVLLLLVRLFNGHNNGFIGLGVREAADKCHMSQATACRAFQTLEKVELIKRTYMGHSTPFASRHSVASQWNVNFLRNKGALPEKQRPFQQRSNGRSRGETTALSK